MIAYESELDGCESHVALVYGNQIGGESNDRSGNDPVLVRVHTHCLTGEAFGATLCDCRALLDNSLRMIAEAGQGALIYLHNGARGFGIDRSGIASSGEMAPNRLVLHRDSQRNPGHNEPGEDRARRTLRQIGLGSQILSDLGIQRIRLLTNTPTNIPALQGFGIEIVEQVRVPLDASADAVPTAQ
jgi:3,4-dihydroxy 2-butanone 4-phosphate synthase/GTP cyclohydrolase II